MKLPRQVLITALPLLGACYSFRTIGPAALPAPGAEVRTEVIVSAGDGPFRPGGRFVTREQTVSFRGHFVRWEADTLTIAIPSDVLPITDTLRVPSEHVARLEMMYFDSRKTLLWTSVLSAIGAAYVYLQLQGERGRMEEPPIEQGDFRTPVFRLRLP